MHLGVFRRSFDTVLSICDDFRMRLCVCWFVHAFYFISNTFISNARLKFANFQNLSRKILRTELWNLCQMFALFPNSILNPFLSGRVRPTYKPGPRKIISNKKKVYCVWMFSDVDGIAEPFGVLHHSTSNQIIFTVFYDLLVVRDLYGYSVLLRFDLCSYINETQVILKNDHSPGYS